MVGMDPPSLSRPQTSLLMRNSEVSTSPQISHDISNSIPLGIPWYRYISLFLPPFELLIYQLIIAHKLTDSTKLSSLQPFHSGWMTITGWWLSPSPLKNDGVRQLGWWFFPFILCKYIYIKVMFQTTNQSLVKLWVFLLFVPIYISSHARCSPRVHHGSSTLW